jgi:hypothetical protein
MLLAAKSDLGKAALLAAAALFWWYLYGYKGGSGFSFGNLPGAFTLQLGVNKAKKAGEIIG